MKWTETFRINSHDCDPAGCVRASLILRYMQETANLQLQNLGPTGDELAELASEFVTITPESSRALPAEELAKLLKSEGKPVTVGGEIADGIEIALRHAEEHNGAVCCVGSLYQAGEVLEYFQNKEAGV